MAYLKVIETSQTWVCPKTADYKIICVAGGEGGSIGYQDTNKPARSGGQGGDTSFGSYITASGYGSKGGGLENLSNSGGGGGGYNLQTYGGTGGTMESSRISSPTCNGGAALMAGSGYGAGGGGYSNKGGNGGKLSLGVFNIEQDEEINCVVGTGGLKAVGGEANGYYTYASDGEDGVIVIQEV